MQSRTPPLLESKSARRPLTQGFLGVTFLLLALFLGACAQWGSGARESEEPRSFVVYPPPPELPRIQFLARYSANVDVVPPRTGFAAFVKGETDQVKSIGKPYGLAMHDGSIFVCDMPNHMVRILDLRNRTFTALGDKAAGKLVRPVNIEIDEDGTRYVVDLDRRMVLIYDQANQSTGSLNEPKDSTGKLKPWEPIDIAIQGKKIYVLDHDNMRVLVFDKKSGELQRSIGDEGVEAEHRLFRPTGLEVDPEGNVYVVDGGNYRVMKYDSKGRFKQQFGSIGKGLGQFTRPKGIAIDREGRLYVGDAAFANVQVFDPEGAVLLFFGGAGNLPDSINLPVQIEIDYDGVDVFADRAPPGFEIEYLIGVTSQFGPNKVSVFGFLKKVSEDEDSPEADRR